MKTLGRYSIFVDHPQELIVSFEHHLGDWCKSEDVAELEADNKRLRELDFDIWVHQSWADNPRIEFDKWLEQALKEE